MSHSDRVRASSVQEQFWLIHSLNPDTSGYNVASKFSIKGPLDIRALRKSVAEIVSRHEIFRTVFSSEDGKLYQVILPSDSISLNVEEMFGVSKGMNDEKVQGYIQAEIDRPFDLSAGPLVRLNLVRLSTDESVLLVVMHHIITDLHSNDLFGAELSNIYSKFIDGRGWGESIGHVQYRQYSKWQTEWLKSREYKDALEWWVDHLKSKEGYLNFPYDKIRPSVETFSGDACPILLEHDFVDGLHGFSKNRKTNTFLVLLASYLVLLYRYSGQEEIIVGVPFTNRRRDDCKEMMGCFINNIPICANIVPAMTFGELLLELRKEMLLAHRRQEVPYKNIVAATQIEKSPTYNPLFQVGFTFQHPMQLELIGLEVESLPTRVSDIQLDLFPTLWEKDGQIKGNVFFNSNLLHKETVERFVRHWKVLLESLIDQEDVPIGRLPMLGKDEKAVLLDEWNSTYVEYPRNCCLHGIFEQQVRKTPDAVALYWGGVTLSYEELNIRANQLAHYLIGKGVGPDLLVGVHMERSIEMVVALYGIIKAGGAYVALDPSFPEERLSFMMEDAKLTVVLTQERIESSLPNSTAQHVCLDSEWQRIESELTDNPYSEVTEQNLAYVLFTSGSTGKPKGAMNQHDAICNRLFWMQDEFQLTSGDKVLQKTPYSFDVSVWEFFWPLQVGAALVIAPPDSHYDPQELIRLIDNYGVTTIHFVPSMLQLFLEGHELQGKCKSLNSIICSGEALSYELQKKVFDFFPEKETKLYNFYGPTEAAVDVTSWHCVSSYEQQIVPIGKPIANTKLYVVDSYLQPTPIGVAGELLIGGIQVARGYLNRSELTAATFIDNPFSKAGGKLYKTGDLVRYLSDGTIEYLGRIDHQVKLHGLRIELGEIEAIASNHKMINQAVVTMVTHSTHDKVLVLHVVPDVELDYTASDVQKELKHYLMSKLPAYMVPGLVVVSSSFPLTSSGKVNRKALPVPEFSIDPDTVDRNLVGLNEKLLHGIWERVLGHCGFGRDSNFFDVGGDSLQAIMVMTAFNKEMGSAVPVVKFFQYPTIKAFVQFWDEKSVARTHANRQNKNILRQKAMLAGRKRNRK